MARPQSIGISKLDTSLLQARLAGQFLSTQIIESPQTLVQKMGALQAQHFDMAKWAIGKRLNTAASTDHISTGNKNAMPLTTIGDVHKAIENGEIVRTHALRPTWHFLAGDDLLWILQLTGPGIKKALFSRDKVLGITQKEYVKSDEAIRRILEDQPALTRQALVGELTEYGFVMDEYRNNHYIMHAELNGIICSGPVQGNKHTYALSENILGKRFVKAVKLKEVFKGEAAVYELAKRYFSTRGPATLLDFAWWSQISLTAIKKAIAALGKSIEVIDQGGLSYYQIADAATITCPKDEGSGLQLLPAFDEYLISYKDRAHMLHPKYSSQVITSNGIFRPVVIENGKVVCIWQVENVKQGCKIKLTPLESLSTKETKRLQLAAEKAAAHYAAFCQVPLVSVKFV